MLDPTHTSPHALRWRALLAEHTAIQKEHLELSASCGKSVSAKQVAQLESTSVRLQILSLQVRALVDEWAADAPSTARGCLKGLTPLDRRPRSTPTATSPSASIWHLRSAPPKDNACL